MHPAIRAGNTVTDGQAREILRDHHHMIGVKYVLIGLRPLIEFLAFNWLESSANARQKK